MFFARYPQPWRPWFLGLFVAFIAVFVMGLILDVNNTLRTLVLLGIIAIQVGLHYYLRRSGQL
jgi:hypothetical protein